MADDRAEARDLYRHTWELELLISGAVVFALLQLPGAVDGWFAHARQEAGVGLEQLTFLAYYVLKLILYTLIAAFLTHLCARALWVGLIGLDSVFPDGIRWERSEVGPIQNRIRRERTPTIAKAIERTDAVASVIFSAAFAIVLMLVIVGVASAVFGVISLAAGALLGPGAIQPVFWAFYFAFFVVASVANIADKLLAERLTPGSRAARGLETIMRAFHRVLGPLGRVANTITLTLSTNMPRGRGTQASIVVLTLLIGVFTVRDLLVARGALRLDGYAYFPDFDGPEAVLPAFYDSDRPADRRSLDSGPSIQSDVVTDPYVRLFIPISASRLTEIVQGWCPGVEPLHGSGIRLGRRPRGEEAEEAQEETSVVLACIEGMQRISLDGNPLATDLNFHVHAGRGQRGVLMMIATGGLAPGRHRLEVERIPDPALASSQEDPEAQTAMAWVIPFWTP
jgi:hypothetical protein